MNQLDLEKSESSLLVPCILTMYVNKEEKMKAPRIALLIET